MDITNINKKVLKRFKPMTMALYPKKNKNLHTVAHFKFIRPKKSFKYYSYYIRSSKNNKFVPELSYVKLLRTYMKLVNKDYKRCVDLKNLRNRNNQLLNIIKSSHIIKKNHNQHIDYNKLNNRIDNFKKLVDRN